MIKIAKLKTIAILTILLGPYILYAKDFKVKSPNGQNVVIVKCETSISFSISNRNANIIDVSNIALNLDVAQLSENPNVESVKYTSHAGTINVEVPTKFKTIKESYNQLELEFLNNISLVFRVYDNGVAYRFETRLTNKEILVNSESFSFDVKAARNTIWPYEFDKQPDPMQSSFQYGFKDIPYQQIDSTTVGLPAYFTASNGSKVVFTESDLLDYPNVFIKKAGALTGKFPHPILEQRQISDRKIQIVKVADYIAKTEGTRTYPWRLWMIDNDDAGLLTNNLVFQLATPSKIKETGFIKPGKVAWDWWNYNNIYGVDFRAGLNTKTYKYYIDFASRFGLEYLLIDEGWTRSTTDLTHTNPNIDIREIVRYGKEKNVDILVWVLWGGLDKKMEEILDVYENWGLKGIKVDFMGRGEQYIVNFYQRLAEACAKRKMMVDFHAAYKPTGLGRTYPNVMTYEGVQGLETVKWESTVTPSHDVNLPFTRMMAGPMDYTPGAMKNANEKNFYPVFTEPMSMGTRAHQTALYVVFESPWMMMSDSPSNYLKDVAYTDYLSRFPTIWDETKVLYANAGKAVITARRFGKKWYVGGITYWKKFETQIDFTFLGKGNYEAQILADGINADRVAEDYRITTRAVNRTDKYEVKMAPGGGFTIILSPMDNQ
ncbi:glycoside hydrolase family 97 catalytic domain-containing protein [Pedobacter sp. MC2016-05]|uniref:glycoside hydrolase family 97 protein n=1 Tax=Pedobacter sp. MC2016-05 TaxID=2994474 RepID=UPI0022471C3F|nr:glycoside hydrolase family 97 protein [Pedobacter sp. MC2016-05]MCX2473749.1 glycoside hydrolase family 97 catalytic domain-containing protein [Pedobacter sp. MC2016-05]